MFVNARVVLLCSTALLAGAATAWAQAEGVIRGRIVAAADGSALAGAAVTLTLAGAGEPLHTTADATGTFVLTRVRPGEYVLSTSVEGFGAREVRLVLEPREIRSVTVALDLAPIAVDVSVTGDAGLPGTHSPSSTVLTMDRLEALPAAQRTNVPEALVTLAPGMIRGHDDLVHIRGHEMALNPLINGVSFWENPHSIFSSGLSPDTIETANVLTGGFPAEYGNRFGGVVDIVTKSGFTMQDRGTAILNAGEAGRRHATGETGGSGGRFGYYAFGSFFESNRFLSPPDAQAIHDDARGAQAMMQVDWNAGRSGSLRALVIGGGVNLEIPRTPLDVELRPLASAEQRTRQQTAIAGWSQTWSDTLLSASAYQRWSRLRLTPAAGPLAARAALERELRTLGGKADVTRAGRRHTIKTGVDVVRLQPREQLAYDYAGYRDWTHLLDLPHIHIPGQAIAFSGRDTGGQLSAYVQDAIELSDRMTVDLGVRVDRYELAVAATHASPRANAAIQVGGAIVHASYNRFFVPPPIEGVLSSSAGLTRFIQEIGAALPALAPTVEDQVELGVTTAVRSLQLGAAGYYRASDNPVHTTVWSDSRIYSYAAFDRARAYGLELKGEAPGLARYGVTAYGNYALGRVYFYNPVTGGFVTEADHVGDAGRFLGPMDQTHTLTAGFTYSHAPSGVRFGTAFEYGSGTAIGHGEEHDHDEGADHAAADETAVRVPGHFTANLLLGIDLMRGSGRRARLSLQVDVENVTNDVYLVAQESQFSPRQFSIPRLLSVTAKLRF